MKIQRKSILWILLLVFSLSLPYSVFSAGIAGERLPLEIDLQNETISAEARAYFYQAFKTANELKGSNTDYNEAARDIALGLAQKGLFAKARAAANYMVAYSDKYSLDLGKKDRIAVYNELAWRAYQASQPELASSLLKDSLALARDINSSADLLTVAKHLGLCGNHELALSIAAEFLTEKATGKSNYNNQLLLIEVLLIADHQTEAVAQVNKWFANNTDYLGKAAVLLAKYGQFEPASAIAAQIIPIAAQVKTMANIAKYLALKGEPEKAETMFNQALTRAARVTGKNFSDQIWKTAWIYADIVAGYGESGYLDKAVNCLNKTLSTYLSGYINTAAKLAAIAIEKKDEASAFAIYTVGMKTLSKITLSEYELNDANGKFTLILAQLGLYDDVLKILPDEKTFFAKKNKISFYIKDVIKINCALAEQKILRDKNSAAAADFYDKAKYWLTELGTDNSTINSSKLDIINSYLKLAVNL
jgi:hypothetical protein